MTRTRKPRLLLLFLVVAVGVVVFACWLYTDTARRPLLVMTAAGVRQRLNSDQSDEGMSRLAA